MRLPFCKTRTPEAMQERISRKIARIVRSAGYGTVSVDFTEAEQDGGTVKFTAHVIGIEERQ